MADVSRWLMFYILGSLVGRAEDDEDFHVYIYIYIYIYVCACIHMTYKYKYIYVYIYILPTSIELGLILVTFLYCGLRFCISGPIFCTFGLIFS